MSASTEAECKKLYEKMVADGKDEDAIQAALAAATPAITVFNQIDVDKSGGVDAKELQRMLKGLPRKKPMPPPEGWPDGKCPFVPFEAMVDALDGNKDGARRRPSCSIRGGAAASRPRPRRRARVRGGGRRRGVWGTDCGVAAAASLALGREGGRPARLGPRLRRNSHPGPRRRGDPPPQTIRVPGSSPGSAAWGDFASRAAAPRRSAPRTIRNSESFGLGSAARDRPRRPSRAGIISLEEWVENLGKLPGLKAAIDQNLDAATGKLAGYLSLEARLEKLAADGAGTKLHGTFKDAVSLCAT